MIKAAHIGDEIIVMSDGSIKDILDEYAMLTMKLLENIQEPASIVHMSTKDFLRTWVEHKIQGEEVNG